MNSSTQNYEDIDVLLNSELEKIGATLNINKVAPAQYSELINNKKAGAYLGKYTKLLHCLVKLASSHQLSGEMRQRVMIVDVTIQVKIDLMKKLQKELGTAKYCSVSDSLKAVVTHRLFLNGVEVYK